MNLLDYFTVTRKQWLVIVLITTLPLVGSSFSSHLMSVDTIKVDTLIDLDNFFEILERFEDIEDTDSIITVASMARNKIPQRQLEGYHKKAFDYIDRFATVAIGEQDKFGIPASITLAQGLLESGFGKSRMANTINNHFGIKCTRGQRRQKGKCYIFEDDTKYDRFVKFESAWASYRAHSRLLQNERYKALYTLEIDDYEGWALGLQKAGYASDNNYAKKLVRIIELYELYEYDER